VEVQVIAPYPLGGALTVRPPQGLESLRVTLTCVLSGGVPPFHFAWLFGDGTSGSTTVATTAHVYPQAGNYSAVVQVTDAAMATARATTIVRVYAPLEVNGTADPPAGPAPLVVTLEASLHGGLPPYNVSWESGTGQVNNTSVAVVEFDRAGSYVATFHVTDASGQSDSGEVDILVLAPRPVLLGANATLLQLEPNRTGCGDVPEDATLGASGSGGVEPYTFAWSFGDGGTGSGSITRHSYARPGNYTVLVEVQDSTGANTSTSLSIEIRGVTCPTSPPPAIGWLAPVVGIGLGGTVVVGVLAVLWRGHHPRTGPPDS
jgi:PKD repeat protein